MFDASDIANACSTISTMRDKSGRGSSISIVLFSANACVRSWITDAPSP